MKHELILVVDFGGQYNQLIARRVRENNVYCEIIPYSTDIEVIKAKNPKGIIFTGGPNSAYLENSPSISKEIFEIGVPILGICYGHQIMSHVLGGVVRKEKGCNLPNLDRKNWGVSEKDLEDIRFALDNKVDIIDYSYCSYMEECREFKNIVFKNLKSNQFIPKLWGKIETNEGINNIKEVAKELDGIVIARGDLTAEIGILNVPIVQEKILYALKNENKSIIVATNVLSSIRNKQNKPTINELSDIYHFIRCGATGFMLTGETSTGENEEYVVTTLKNSIKYYEKLLSKIKKRSKRV